MKNSNFSLTVEKMDEILVGVDAEIVIDMKKLVFDIQTATLCAIASARANLDAFEFVTKIGRDNRAYAENFTNVGIRLVNQIKDLIEETRNRVNATKILVEDLVFVDCAKDCFKAFNDLFTSRGYTTVIRY